MKEKERNETKQEKRCMHYTQKLNELVKNSCLSWFLMFYTLGTLLNEFKACLRSTCRCSLSSFSWADVGVLRKKEPRLGKKQNKRVIKSIQNNGNHNPVLFSKEMILTTAFYMS